VPVVGVVAAVAAVVQASGRVGVGVAEPVPDPVDVGGVATWKRFSLKKISTRFYIHSYLLNSSNYFYKIRNWAGIILLFRSRILPYFSFPLKHNSG
jgi:hypothetical protein